MTDTTASPPNPDAFSQSWACLTVGEPSLSQVINDPIVALIMRRDGISCEDLLAVITKAQHSLFGRFRMAA